MPLSTEPAQAPRRRQPSQDRSREKQALIFEAAIRILDQHGLAGLSTNRIADVAGISVGTLYQYYSNKQEILAALARREVAQVLLKIGDILGSGAAAPVPDRLRALVRIVLGAFGGRHRVRKILLEAALANGNRQAVDSPVRQVADLLASGSLTAASGLPLVLTPMEAFVLTQAVSGVIRAALAYDESWLGEPELEDKLVCLIRGYLGALKTSP